MLPREDIREDGNANGEKRTVKQQAIPSGAKSHFSEIDTDLRILYMVRHEANVHCNTQIEIDVARGNSCVLNVVGIFSAAKERQTRAAK
jgi:hypothetical protein